MDDTQEEWNSYSGPGLQDATVGDFAPLIQGGAGAASKLPLLADEAGALFPKAAAKAAEMVDIGAYKVPAADLDAYIGSVKAFNGAGRGSLEALDAARAAAHHNATMSALSNINKKAASLMDIGSPTYNNVRNSIGKFAEDVLQAPTDQYAKGGEVMPNMKSKVIRMMADGGEVTPDMSAFLQGGPDMSALNAGTVPTASPFDIASSGSAPITTPAVNAPIPLPPAAPQPTALPTPPPQPPPASIPNIQQVAQTLKQTPDTNYDFFKNMSADDRLALQKQLMNKNNSAGSLIAQGAAGLGDAISNSFGGKNTSFQKGVMENNQKQMDNQLAAADTYRNDKMQDMQANMEAQKNDPNSPLSASMRKTLQSAGLNVPSGMNATVMLQVAGPLGELAMKQATLSMQKQQVDATVANQSAERRVQAAKDLGDRSIGRKVLDYTTGDSPETKVLRDELNETGHTKNATQAAPVMPHGVPDLGSTFNGQKVLKVTKVK